MIKFNISLSFCSFKDCPVNIEDREDTDIIAHKVETFLAKPTRPRLHLTPYLRGLLTLAMKLEYRITDNPVVIEID